MFMGDFRASLIKNDARQDRRRRLAINGQSGPGCAEYLGDGRRRHGIPIGGALSLQPFLGPLFDQQVDERQPLVLVNGFSQQLSVATEIKSRILLTHLTPPRTRSQGQSVSQPADLRNGLA
jgi:hypothetical protein